MKIIGRYITKTKPLYIALTTIYGIGYYTAKKLLKMLNIDIKSYLSNISNKQFHLLKNYIYKMHFKVEDNLKRKIFLKIKQLQDINCYKGRRHLKGLPLRGQTTRANSRTSRKLCIIKNNILSEINGI